MSEEIPEIPMIYVIFDEVYIGTLPKSATDKKFAEFVRISSKEKLRENDECVVKIQFNSHGVNLGNISSGTVKPIIDCLYPVLGGKPGAPDDHAIRTLIAEKGVNSIPQGSVRIVIGKFSSS